jgi:hypothetical protein
MTATRLKRHPFPCSCLPLTGAGEDVDEEAAAAWACRLTAAADDGRIVAAGGVGVATARGRGLAAGGVPDAAAREREKADGTASSHDSLLGGLLRPHLSLARTR